MTTFDEIKLTGNIDTATLADGLYSWAGDTPLDQTERFVDAALDAYAEIIEDITGGTWRRSYSELIVDIDTELPEDWQEQISDRIADLDLVPIFEKATA